MFVCKYSDTTDNCEQHINHRVWLWGKEEGQTAASLCSSVLEDFSQRFPYTSMMTKSNGSYNDNRSNNKHCFLVAEGRNVFEATSPSSSVSNGAVSSVWGEIAKGVKAASNSLCPESLGSWRYNGRSMYYGQVTPRHPLSSPSLTWFAIVAKSLLLSLFSDFLRLIWWHNCEENCIFHTPIPMHLAYIVGGLEPFKQTGPG